MRTALIVLIVALVFAQLISAVELWLSGRLFRVAKASLWRAAAIVLFLTLLMVPIAFMPFHWAVFLAASATGVLIAFPVVQYGFGTTFSKGALITVTWLAGTIVSNLAVGFLVGIAIRIALIEPFVVPTGAMANAVFGFHKEVICPDCGFSFAVNASAEGDVTPDRPATPVIGCVCPNCRTAVALSLGEPPLLGGDRLLVDKTGVRERFSLVVFDYPREPVHDGLRIRYLKRLIGLQGETVAIHGGKLYVTDALFKGKSTGTREVGEAAMHRNDEAAVRLFQEGPSETTGRFHILRKPPDLVLAMRHIVFDNDFQARDRAAHPARWTGTGWHQEGDTPKSFTHSPGGGIAWLRYRHLVKPDHPQLITEVTSYNEYELGRGNPQLPTRNWASDLMLEFEADVNQTNEGDELIVELSKGVDRFRARFQLASGACQFTRTTGEQEDKLAPALPTTAVRGVGKHAIRFANVDERLLLWVDETLVSEVIYPAPKQEGPTDSDLEPASIGAKGAGLKVASLKLWRDNYYTCTHSAASIVITESVPEDLLTEPARWGQQVGRFPVMTMFVQPGHSLCLGDNSAQSSDSRFWGLVPDAMMIGPVAWRYWGSRAGPVR